MLKVKGWSKFQHYKKRNPPWIRLYRDLLEKKEWHKLSYASRSLALAIWLIASENEDVAAGLVTDDYEELAFRARMKDTDVVEAIKELIQQGFVEHITSDQADLLAPCYQVATPETRSRDQRSDTEDQDPANIPEKYVDNVDKSNGSGSLKKGSSVLGQGGLGLVGSYDVRDQFAEDDWQDIQIRMRDVVNDRWDRKVVFEKYNKFVKTDPPKKPKEAFMGWLEKNRTWLGRPP